MEQATREQFRQFVDNYPRKLVVDVCGISEPPLVSYNDFTLGNWPESMVAKHHDAPQTKYWISDVK